MDVSWNHTVTCCYDQQYRHANRLYLQINEQIFLVWPCSLWLQKPSSKWWAFMKSRHLLSSNAFFSLVSRPELPHWLAPLFFSSRKAFFLISLALCSLISLSLCFQHFEYLQGPQCLRCAIFFAFLSMRNCIRLTVMYVTIGFSMVKYHNISALLHSQWLLQSCVGTNCF